MSNREKIRKYFEKMKTGTAAGSAKALGIPSQTAYANVRDLYEQGWLKKIPGCLGMYEYNQLKDHEHGRSVDLQVKIWRSMRLSKSFTAWDIAMYSGASLAYVKEYISFLMGKGFVSRTGKRGQKAIYAVKTEPDIDTPVMRSAASTREVQHQDIIDLGWKLMLALRDGETADAKKLLAMLCIKSGGTYVDGIF